MIFSVFQKNRVFGYSWSNRKPRFPMDYRPLGKGHIANFGIFLDVFEFLRVGWFFPFFKKFWFLGILGSPYCGIGATIRIGRGMLCLLYAGFFMELFVPPKKSAALSCYNNLHLTANFTMAVKCCLAWCHRYIYDSQLSILLVCE